MKKILRATLALGGSSGLVLFINVIKTKAVAIFLGPAGVGVLSQISTFFDLAGVIASLGLSSGIIKYVSTYRAQNKAESLQEVHSSSFILLSISSFLIWATGFIFASKISYAIFGTTDYSLFIRIATIGVPFFSFFSLYISYVNGYKNIRAISLAKIISATIGLLFVVPLLWWFGLTGAVIHLTVYSAIQFLVIFYFFNKTIESAPLGDFYHLSRFNKNILQGVISYGIVSLIVAALVNFVFLFLRSLIINQIGIEQNGIFQVIWSLSMGYLTIILSSISTYSYPLICELEDNQSRTQETNNAVRIALLIIIPIISGIIIFREQFVNIFYSPKFLFAANLIPIQLFGDFFKILAWVVGISLLAMNKLKIFLALGLVWGGLFFMCSYFLLPKIGLYGITWSYLITNLIHFTLVYLYLRSVMNFRFSDKNYKLIIYSLLLMGISFLTYYIPSLYFGTIFGSLTIIWFFLCTDKEERGKFLRNPLAFLGFGLTRT